MRGAFLVYPVIGKHDRHNKETAVDVAAGGIASSVLLVVSSRSHAS